VIRQVVLVPTPTRFQRISGIDPGPLQAAMRKFEARGWQNLQYQLLDDKVIELPAKNFPDLSATVPVCNFSKRT
jgi:hypothetical protein